MPDFNREITPAGDNHDAFGRAYLFTNENAGGYINQLNMHGGRILSVAAGGDHAFESLLNGARVVDLFDINYAQKVIVELKSRMIKSLPYEDFMDFFFEKKHFMDRKIIEPIYNDFSRELALYIDWFYCMGNCARHGRDMTLIKFHILPALKNTKHWQNDCQTKLTLYILASKV